MTKSAPLRLRIGLASVTVIDPGWAWAVIWVGDKSPSETTSKSSPVTGPSASEASAKVVACDGL